MKFKIAVILSLLLHFTVFAVAIFSPSTFTAKETTYFVDLISMGNRGGEGRNTEAQKTEATVVEKSAPAQAQVKNLTVAKPKPPELTYAEKTNKKNKLEEKKADDKVVTVVKRNVDTAVRPGQKTGGADEANVLHTGLVGSGGRSLASGAGEGALSQSPYAYYYGILRNKISQAWYGSLVNPDLKGKFLTAVCFKIARNGRIFDVDLEHQSGDVSLDLSARRAVENAAPFPLLPADFPADFLIVHFEFVWEK